MQNKAADCFSSSKPGSSW